MKTCTQCNQQFKITDKDRAFYAKMQVPEPNSCPDCREMRRLAWRNERGLYLTDCGMCKQKMFTMYHPPTPFPVFCETCWNSDKWGAEDFAIEYDKNKSFFHQFRELYSNTPKQGTATFDNVNSEFINNASWCKNCYLSYGANYNENVYYSNYVNRDKFSSDLLFVHDSELCYECVDCQRCYNLKYSRMSFDCTESAFLSDCRNCLNCFACAGLRNKNYCIFNKQYNKEEYQEEIKKFDLTTRMGVASARQKAHAVWHSVPIKSFFGEKVEHVTGNGVFNAKECFHAFDATEIENCSYVGWLNKAKDCYDIYSWGFTLENSIECVEVGAGSSNLKFCKTSFAANHSMEYSFDCKNCHDVFGCSGLRGKEYCILNKQYTKEEFVALRAAIIRVMKEAGEYGEFVPPSFSPFGYNETKAIELYPLSKNEALARGFRWQDDMPGTTGRGTVTAADMPEGINDVQESMTAEIFTCECLHNCFGHVEGKCEKNYKIVKQEIALYKQMGVPLPTQCPNCRHAKRMASRGTHTLYVRSCACCNKNIQTVYAPDRPEKVYCETCYNKEIV